MLTRVFVVSTIAVATLVPAQAQQQAPFQQWLNEEVRWIISDAERTAFQKLETDAERRTFMDIFWRVRNPTPNEPFNPFRDEHYRRLRWANDRFGGPNTDRGMVYIRFGAPDQQEANPASENWTYKLLEGVGNDVVLHFTNSADAGGYVLNPADKNRLTPAPSPADRAANSRSGNIFERLKAMDLAGQGR